MANKSLAATARKALLRRGRGILRRYQGSTSADDDLLAALSENEHHELEEIHGALERIERGIFGRCEICFETIDRGRLEAVPWLRRCDKCAADRTEAEAPIQELET